MRLPWWLHPSVVTGCGATDPSSSFPVPVCYPPCFLLACVTNLPDKKDLPLNGLFCKHVRACKAAVCCRSGLAGARATVWRDGSIHAAAGRFEALSGASLFSENFFHFKNLKGLIQTSRPCGPLWFQDWLLLDPESGIQHWLWRDVARCGRQNNLEYKNKSPPFNPDSHPPLTGRMRGAAACCSGEGAPSSARETGAASDRREA